MDLLGMELAGLASLYQFDSIIERKWANRIHCGTPCQRGFVMKSGAHNHAVYVS